MDSSFVQAQLEPKATHAERQIISLHLFSVLRGLPLPQAMPQPALQVKANVVEYCFKISAVVMISVGSALIPSLS
jgi:hypothetical protein